jgi:3-hydroxyisobutyrate dehydrogenase
LRFMVGGSGKALDTARPVLAVLGRDIVHFGPTGSGALIKLINNFVCGVQAAALAEAVAFIDAAGLDRQKAIAILTDGAPASPLVKTLAARAGAEDFTPNFVLRLMTKDLDYSIREAGRHGQTLQTAESALAVFRQAIASGYGEKDFSAVLASAAHAPSRSTKTA